MPAAHDDTKSFMGMPASARATAAAFMDAHRVPPSASMISTKTSMTLRGYRSRKSAGSMASVMTMLISWSLLEGAGDRLGSTLKGAMWYLHLSIPLLGLLNRLGCISLGP